VHNYQPSDLQRLTRVLTDHIQEDLLKAGIFFRIYSRCKSNKSLEKKLGKLKDDGNLKYDGQTKFLRDLIGVRINLYFVDDLEILLNYYKEKHKTAFLEEAIDIHKDSEFKPTRVNLIFKIPDDLKEEFRGIVPEQRVDSSFELQLRTVFSEGWHEVEHDFRYKCQDDWKDHNALSRTFNGMLAALEIHEWGMLKVFSELSYSYYKSGNYGAMIRMYLRIRTEDYYLTAELQYLLEQEKVFLKDFYKLERTLVLRALLEGERYIPFLLDNLVYMINFLFLKNEKILSATPTPILEELKRSTRK
jgi:putative GTP pyrophosphokinase